MTKVSVSAGQPISGNPSAPAAPPTPTQSSPPRPATSEAPNGARALPLRLLDHVREAFRRFVAVLPCGPRRPGASVDEPPSQRPSSIDSSPLEPSQPPPQQTLSEQKAPALSTEEEKEIVLALHRRDIVVRASARGLGLATEQIQGNVDRALAALAAEARLDASPRARDQLSGYLRDEFLRAQGDLRRFRVMDGKQLGERARLVDVMPKQEEDSKVVSLFVAAGLAKLPEDDRRPLLQAMGIEELQRVANVDKNATSASTEPVLIAVQKELTRRATPEYQDAERLRRDTDRIKSQVAATLGRSLYYLGHEFWRGDSGKELKQAFSQAESSLKERENALGLDFGKASDVRPAATLIVAAALGEENEKDRQLLLREMQLADLERLAQANPDTPLDEYGLSSTDGDKIAKVIRAAQQEAARREYPVSQALREARTPQAAQIPPSALEDIEKNVREELVNLAHLWMKMPEAQLKAQLTGVFSRADSGLGGLDENGAGIGAEGSVRAASLFVAAGLAGLDEDIRKKFLSRMQPQEIERLSTIAEDSTREQINPVIHAANREIVRREVDSGRTFESAAADFCKMMEIPFWNGKLERVAQYLIKLEQHLAALTACYKKTGRNMDPVVTNHHSRIGEALRGWLKEKLPGWLKKGSEVWEELPSDMRASTLAALEYFGAPPPQELLKQLKKLK